MRQLTVKQSVVPFLMAASLVFGFQNTAFSATNIVTEIAPNGTSTLGVWEENDVRIGGTASIEDLTGLGGDLENNQPLPIGAALLTTAFVDAAKAEIGVYNEYGLAGEIIPSLQLAFDYQKAANPGQNISASPSIKLTFYNPVCEDVASAGDCYGTLVWEAYWQGSGNPPIDTWTPASINQSTGLFWWTGGFGVGNGAGGPPLNTLADWLTTFSSDFPGSSLVLVSVGVGSYGQGQIGYFDNVSISHGFGTGFSELYDFEPPAAEVVAPIPFMSNLSAALLMFGLAIVGFTVLRRKNTVT